MNMLIAKSQKLWSITSKLSRRLTSTCQSEVVTLVLGETGRLNVLPSVTLCPNSFHLSIHLHHISSSVGSID